MERLYVVHFPLTHPTFRIPVLRSVADQYGIPLKFYPLPRDEQAHQASSSTSESYSYQSTLDSYDASYDPERDTGRPFAIVALRNDDDALTLLLKCTVVRSICQLWAMGVSPSETKQALTHASSRQWYEHLIPESYSWKADVTVIGFKLTYEEKKSRIEACEFMGFQGPVNLSTPHFEWVWMEERWCISGGDTALPDPNAQKANAHRLTVVGRKITTTSPRARDWIDRLDLKKRSYIGNTSMESEMSLNLAEMAQAAKGKLIYDPFVGTGSLLIACAALGSYVMGSDIDGRMIRGKKARQDPTAETGIITAAKQYNLEDKFLDCLTFDITQHPWRLNQATGLLDSIVADPPYGVRAGAKRLGQRDTKKNDSTPIWLPERNGYAHQQDDYIPPTRPYALVDLLSDLLRFSAILLKDGGRLVFWMPVMNEDSTTTHVPTGKEWITVAVSTQDFGKWARRLVTLQRRARSEVHEDDLRNTTGLSQGHAQFHQDSGRFRANVDASDFRNRYFGPNA